MTTVCLVRHGHYAGLGDSLPGLTPGVTLDDEGHAQMAALAHRLRGTTVGAIYASPVQRAVESAHTLAAALGLPVTAAAELEEMDVGAWTGRSIRSLAGDAAWTAFNTHRTTAAVPGGTTMLEVQARAVRWMLALPRRHGSATIVAVSHADVIRALLAACLGVGLDLMLRIDVDPASLSVVAVGPGTPQVRGINDTAHLAPKAPMPADPPASIVRSAGTAWANSTG